MARPFKELRDRMSPEARERVDRRVRETLLEMTLQELRQQVSGLTQTQLAELMEVTQGAISQLEKRHDVLISKLASYVHALGGELELIARFPDVQVRIAQFDAEDETPTAANG
jgi:transcriptional regulator with XRE-family HTH domain